MATRRPPITTRKPPEPPRIERRLTFHPVQAIGVPLIVLIPVLALLGLLGEATARTTVQAGGVEVTVEYPSRMRYKTVGIIEVDVRNSTGMAIENALLTIDRRYLEGFSNITFTPTATAVTHEAFVVALGTVQPGQSQAVTVEVRAERYWLHEGALVVAGPAGSRAELSTLVLP